MIKAVNIFKSYGDLAILKGVNLEVSESEFVSIVGPSGAGKTTFLQILGTLDAPDKGEVLFQGKSLGKMPAKEQAIFRNKNLGFVFQFHHLLPEFSALENICIPAWIAGTDKRSAEKEAHKLLEMLHLADRATHKPGELSGGEQQRVAVARALINKPALLLADEPTGNLDSNNARDMHQLFLRLKKDLQLSLIVVTHNLELADLADRKISMKDGNVM